MNGNETQLVHGHEIQIVHGHEIQIVHGHETSLPGTAAGFPTTLREGSFGQGYQLSRVDKFGIALSARRIRSEVGTFAGKRFADIGSGYNALLTRELLPQLESAVVVDLTLSDDLKANPAITAMEGSLPEVLDEIPDNSLDIVICMSVLEHVWHPEQTVQGIRRILAHDGICIINVPSWSGKRLLEFSAFRLGFSPAEEMEDHKMYYDPRDLWPLLVAGGFRPSKIKCRKHKFGLNTYAVCRK